MPVANGNSKLLLIGVKGESDWIEVVRKEVPQKCFLGAFLSPMPDYLGSLFCLIRSMLLAGRLATLHGIDPAVATVPEWGDRLYKRGVS
jgi:hypothetical protein